MTKTPLLNSGVNLPTDPPRGSPPVPPGRSPRFIVLAGRGGTGKTLIVRWICELVLGAGHTIVIADGDRTNRNLPHYFEGVLAPPSADDRVVRRWLEAIIDRMITDRFDVIVDLGGGDTILKGLASELDLSAMLGAAGIDVVMLHVTGPEVESLAYLGSVEAPGPLGTPLFAPEHTAVILNNGLVPEDQDPDEAFRAVRESRILHAAVARGVRTVAMPRLRVAHEVNRRHQQFSTAAAGATSGDLPPMTPTDRQRVTLWLRAMDVAFRGVAEWIL